MKHPTMMQKGSGCSGSGWQWQSNNLGNADMQYERVMNSSLGNPATQSSNSINTISNINANNNWKGGRRMRRGGFSVLGEAALPFTLLAAQNMYKPKHSSYKYRPRSSFRNKKRGGMSFKSKKKRIRKHQTKKYGRR